MSSKSSEPAEVSQTATRRVSLVNVDGLCLRTASLLAEAAGQFSSDIRVACCNRSAHAKSILDLVGLLAKPGMELELEARGSDSWKAIAVMTKLIRYGF